MRQKLTLITLGVDDFTKSMDFYEKGLGWKKSDKSLEGLALFPLGGIILALYSRQELADDALVPNTPTGFSGITLSYNAKSKTEVDAVLNQAQKAGGTLIKPPQIVFWGGYSGYFKDPNGHLFEVAYHPSWKFDKNDNILLK